MKDVDSCDKPRGAANRLWSGDFRIGQPDGDESSAPWWIHSHGAANPGNWNI